MSRPPRPPGARLARELLEAGVDAEAVTVRDDLRGADDTTVLHNATVGGRIVVTDDVSTFSIAMAATPEHSEVIYCHRTPGTATAHSHRTSRPPPPPHAG